MIAKFDVSYSDVLSLIVALYAIKVDIVLLMQKLGGLAHYHDPGIYY